ncbi:hypothetical protein SCLCIDRAFT_1211269 [Scleroderma citrinum Foug A]|uniref:Uncharacterized protein n=1 Tax=Scleroderma citrinum Foug A TaxID=1036808 RepID=A0A0C3E153_9AGAM|nr:hypothetical protein SCLCIDRAFT_1211269 [Scleroderma citrinum Foug A]
MPELPSHVSPYQHLTTGWPMQAGSCDSFLHTIAQIEEPDRGLLKHTKASFKVSFMCCTLKTIPPRCHENRQRKPGNETPRS